VLGPGNGPRGYGNGPRVARGRTAWGTGTDHVGQGTEPLGHRNGAVPISAISAPLGIGFANQADRMPLASVVMDVTDATFQSAVLTRSSEVPVIVDLWAPWCGPCTTLGPLLERAVSATAGAVELVKVNVDDNPRIAQSFGVSSIPAVFAIRDGKVVDQFMGAVPEQQVVAFVEKLLPAPSEADVLTSAGDETSLRRALELEPDHQGATEALARILIDRGEATEALALLARVPETPGVRTLAAQARLAESGVIVSATDDGAVDARLTALLERVRDDDSARQEFVDLLETLGPQDPRTNSFRRALAARLY
jgi:putative thioredoxin